MVRMMRLILIFRFGIQPAMQWIWGMTVWLVQTMVVAIIGITAGVPSRARVLADIWTEKAIRLGFPTLYAPQLRNTLLVAAFCEMVLGWISLSYLTVWIVEWILW